MQFQLLSKICKGSKFHCNEFFMYKQAQCQLKKFSFLDYLRKEISSFLGSLEKIYFSLFQNTVKRRKVCEIIKEIIRKHNDGIKSRRFENKKKNLF